MSCRRIRCLLELTFYPLPCSIIMFFQQVELDQLIDWPQAVRRELGSFFKSLARFVISLCLTQSQTQCHLSLWILRRELGFLAADHHGVIKAIKRGGCRGPDHTA